MPSFKKQSGIIVLALILCTLSSVNSHAITEPMRQALIQLGDSDEAARRHAHEVLMKDGDASIIPILEAFNAGLLENRQGSLVIYAPRVQTSKQKREYPLLEALTGKPLVDTKGQPLYSEELPSSVMHASRADRKAISTVIKALSLQHSDPEKRVSAIVTAGDKADLSLLPALQRQLETNPEKMISEAVAESIACIQMIHGSKEERIQAARLLGDNGSARGASSLRKSLEGQTTTDAELKSTIEDALAKIDTYQYRIKLVQNLFSGLSLGSILILMALGLAVIFGLMGVINMAHGEFMMLGAFTAYVVCEGFKRYLPPGFFNYYFLCAVPAAFMLSAFAGWVCEWALIRHLYGRPLETLLATWGLSLVLIQTIRVVFGDTLSLAPPEWLKGSWEVSRDLVFPINRLFIIVFCTVCTLLFYLIVQKTKLGLLLRSTVQDRDTASSLGVPIRRVDGLTFALGTGLAGLAGCVIPLYDKINPGMGQGYVVDSFMVVVLGGLGKLAGVIIGGVGLGFLSKFIEPFLQAVYGKAAVLAMIILFLQWRPQGMFPSKGRLADE
jgi:urea transport system permease protein